MLKNQIIMIILPLFFPNKLILCYIFIIQILEAMIYASLHLKNRIIASQAMSTLPLGQDCWKTRPSSHSCTGLSPAIGQNKQVGFFLQGFSACAPLVLSDFVSWERDWHWSKHSGCWEHATKLWTYGNQREILQKQTKSSAPNSFRYQ